MRGRGRRGPGAAGRPPLGGRRPGRHEGDGPGGARPAGAARRAARRRGCAPDRAGRRLRSRWRHRATATPVPVRFSGQDTARPAGRRGRRLADGARRAGRCGSCGRTTTTLRPIRPEMGGAEGDRNSLSDAAPLHVTSESSLERLNDWVLETALERGEEPREPLGHDRFRPNVVVAGGEPFAEDAWAGCRIGDVPFRATMVCDRCVMTTIDRGVADDEQGADPHPGAAPPVGRRDVVRHPPDARPAPRGRCLDRRRRRGRRHALTTRSLERRGVRAGSTGGSLELTAVRAPSPRDFGDTAMGVAAQGSGSTARTWPANSLVAVWIRRPPGNRRR